MNKICKQYIADAKKFFPVMGKEERAYLKGIVNELEECIEQNNIETKQGLYEHYRQPYDVANDFYSRFETDEIVRKVTTSKYIKIAIVALVVIALVASCVFMYFWNEDNKLVKREEMVDYEQYKLDEATESLEKYTVYDEKKSDGFIDESSTISDEEIVEEEEIIE